MSRYMLGLALVTLIVDTAIFCDFGVAAEAPLSGVTSAELSGWKKDLRQAGASRVEVKEFEELLRRQTPSDLKAWQEWLRHAGASKYLQGTRVEAREQAREAVPSALFSDATPVRSCDSLRELEIPNTTIESATVDATDHSCRVTANVTHPPASDRVKVFIGLPLKTWNGRFRGTGGGGFLGGNPESLKSPISKGYAAGATDTGHEGDSPNFALNKSGQLNWQEIRNFAYLGIHDMTTVGKAVAEAFYGKPPKYSYFVGGSTGGRQALMEAQRFPDDYDGILSACPAINLHRLVPSDFWAQNVMLQSQHFVQKTMLNAATAAAVGACDGTDGVLDGVIDDPNQCTYDPKALVGSKVGEGAFSEADAQVVRRIWEGPRSQDGKFLWYGLARGADLSTVANTEGAPLKGKPFRYPLEWFQYFLVNDPSWDWTTLLPGEFELLFNQSIEQYRAVIGTDDPDLSPFRDHGGKLIVYHGLADEVIPAQGSIDYYERVQEKMGGPERTAEFARLFLVPGVDHGFLGAGPSPTRMMDAIVEWVEGGKAPDRILAESSDKSGNPVRTRSLFPYPQVEKRD